MAGASPLRRAARRLCRDIEDLRFSRPVTHVYNPLLYARRANDAYLDAYGHGPKRVVFLGMNPGPWGMAQTGVPFGEVGVVRDWIGIDVRVGRPEHEHPKRPVAGFASTRSEVSGARLWGAMAQEFGTAERFFAGHFVANYCPLLFLEETGRNRTPDRLLPDERAPLFEACDRHLRSLVRVLEPEWLVGIGAFAERRAQEALAAGAGPRIARILHPSPASPAANRGWADAARRQLVDLGIWPEGAESA